jgi:hypothetical protein
MTSVNPSPARLAETFIETWASGDLDGVAARAGDRAIIFYEMETALYGTLVAAELMRFAEGLIVDSRLVFDTHPVRQAQQAG